MDERNVNYADVKYEPVREERPNALQEEADTLLVDIVYMIIEKRKSLGLTIKELSLMSGVRSTEIVEMERLESKCKAIPLFKVALFLGIEIKINQK